jgi:hypothetical protein
VDNIEYSPETNITFHKILNKSPKVEDFMIKIGFEENTEDTLMGIREILTKGHYVPEL